SLLFIDIDDFKELNRIKGHLYGNVFLKRVAERLRMHTRISDFVCRFGGDEFVLILSGSDRNTALDIASRIRNDLYNTINREGCTVSIGVATFPDDGTKVDDLISSADSAMRRAKNAGKNMIVA
ncbi:MAG: GGDEF domain-containing protein, partial [Nitrospirae bacterium]|nr:GGDEF domain-containing protein [Nitrospirota bacterium]